jgi:gliding motility-associated transport system permease protein/gliding motility-associatede transport system auxiliary component
MNHIRSITKKELRAYFLSPIALIFLGTFILVTLFTFLWVETFFARNIADVRPLFLWLPRLLIFLCAALTMRLWSEEQKLGTLEILLTLPVETRKLVVGKFLAALILVAIALALTFHVPIAVAMMGDLDWGPVVGGYAAALLLAAAYLAIGLCVSAITDNQIVALILTCLSCGVLYVIGTEPVTSAVGTRGAEILSALGTGSRFESIRRGVIDLRDVLYYGSITVAFLVLNTLILKAKGWSQGSQTRARRVNATMLAGLVGANLFALNIWMNKVSAFRVDLTQRHEYSISKVTKDLLRGLPEPLLIRGYFSEKTHPILAPMVPRIRDIIQEYGIIAPGKVRTEFVDPRENEDLEKEANQSYGIKSFPFRVSDRHDVGVVNSYFSILVKYGDQFQVISFDELIEVQVSGQGNVEVRLRNMEYDLTRAIKKVAYGFQTLDSLFADMKGDAELKLFVTPRTMPENFKKPQESIEKVARDIQKISGNKFKFEVVDVDQGGNTMRQDLYQKYGFKPYAVALFSQETFYFHPLIRVGDKLERLALPETVSEADVKKEITSALQRGAPGFLKTIGIVKTLDAPMPDPRFPNQPPHPPPDPTRFITKQLSETHATKDLDLKDGRVPGDIDVLIVFGPKNLDEKQKFAIDQYLMRGGRVLVLGGKYELDPNAQEGVEVKKVNMGIEDMLASWGVTVQDSMVLDAQNESFPIPVVRDLGGIRVRDIQLLPYPFFVDVRPDGMDKDNPVVSGLPAVTLQWVSPLTVTTPEKKEGDDAIKRDAYTLMRSSDKSWTQSDINVQPNFEKYGKTGFAPGADQKAQVLAVVLKGNFESFFKDKPNPLWGVDEKQQGGDRTGRTLKRSPDDARLVVVGSSSFANDFVLQISRQTGSDRFTNNIHFLQNLVDWAVEDTDLLTIRSRGTFARTLRSMEPAKRTTYETVMYVVPVLLLGLIIAFTTGARRRMQPLDLDTGRAPKRLKPEPPAMTSGGVEARP